MTAETESIAIEILSTPNPDALMFRLEEVLVPRGSFEFASAREAEEAPLAAALFALSGVAGVLVASNFVTVTRSEGTAWKDLSASVQQALRDFVDSGEIAVNDVSGPGDDEGSDVEDPEATAKEELRAAREQLEEHSDLIETLTERAQRERILLDLERARMAKADLEGRLSRG